MFARSPSKSMWLLFYVNLSNLCILLNAHFIGLIVKCLVLNYPDSVFLLLFNKACELINNFIAFPVLHCSKNTLQVKIAYNKYEISCYKR